jgi:hypothetical protein
MYYLSTEKQKKYFAEVIRLHFQEGYGEDKIESLLPIGHTTASRWIAIFAREHGKIFGATEMQKPQEQDIPQEQNNNDVRSLQKRIKELEAQLLVAEIKAEAYDEMINVAEAKFKIPIRKKAGAKQ